MTDPPTMRAAWLQLGGFIAAADGLSEEEVAHLAGAAWAVSEAETQLRQGAAYESLPEQVCARALSGGRVMAVESLTEIYAAVGVDGMSAAELGRYCVVAGHLLGDKSVAPLLRLCLLQEEAASLRASLLKGPG